MRIIPHQNAASSVITVTNTATALFTLIDTAGSIKDSQKYFMSSSLNSTGTASGILITPEDGDVRMGVGVTPTASLGTLLSSGTKYFIPNIQIENVKLIRTSGDVLTSVEIVISESDEPYTACAEAVTLEASSITLGNVKITDGTNTAAILARTTGTEQPAATDDALVVYNVGGGAASTSAKYRATTTGQDGTVVYASATTLTLAGLPFTVASEDLVYIREVDTTSNTANLWVNGSGGVHMEISGGTLTRSGGTNFSANGVYEVGYNGQDKGYVAANTGFRFEQYNRPEDEPVDYDLVDTTNISATTHYYPSSAGVTNDGVRDLSFTGKLIDADGTLTAYLEATNDEDTASGDWIKVYGYDDKNDSVVNQATVTNGTLTYALSYNNFNYAHWRWVVVPSGATNTVIGKGRSKKV